VSLEFRGNGACHVQGRRGTTDPNICTSIRETSWPVAGFQATQSDSELVRRSPENDGPYDNPPPRLRVVSAVKSVHPIQFFVLQLLAHASPALVDGPCFGLLFEREFPAKSSNGSRPPLGSRYR